MFGIASRLREVRVGVFQDRILIAMAELARQSGVSIVMMLFCFSCAFGAVGIVIRNFGHTGTPCVEENCVGKPHLSYAPEWPAGETPSLRKRSRACRASGERG